MAPSGLYARLFSPLGKISGRAIYFTDRFFLIFYISSFLMISPSQIISRCTGPIFATFTSNESILAVDDRSGPLLSISHAMATDFVQKWRNSPFSSLWHSVTVWDIATSMGALTAELMPVYCVKIL